MIIKGNTMFDFFKKKVYLCDLMENNEAMLTHNGRSVELPVRNFEVVTLKFII